jgi:hypothetical protein
MNVMSLHIGMDGTKPSKHSGIYTHHTVSTVPDGVPQTPRMNSDYFQKQK